MAALSPTGPPPQMRIGTSIAFRATTPEEHGATSHSPCHLRLRSLTPVMKKCIALLSTRTPYCGSQPMSSEVSETERSSDRVSHPPSEPAGFCEGHSLRPHERQEWLDARVI